MIGLSKHATVQVDALGAVVKPGILVAKQNETVELTNGTDEVIQVFVPACGGGLVLTIQGGATGAINLAGVDAGIHAFAVFSRKAGDFARGLSSPKIIIQ
jgi:hypothetical protein